MKVSRVPLFLSYRLQVLRLPVLDQDSRYTLFICCVKWAQVTAQKAHEPACIQQATPDQCSYVLKAS